MRGWVIVREDGKFVSAPGRDESYTGFLQFAWLLPTRAIAEGHRCPDNERVRSVAAVMSGNH